MPMAGPRRHRVDRRSRMPQARRALAVMTIAHDIQHFCVAGLAVTYPFAVAQFHISSAVLGVRLSAAGLLGGLLQAVAGLLRRASARTVIAAQDLAMGGVSALGAVTPGSAPTAGEGDALSA